MMSHRFASRCVVFGMVAVLLAGCAGASRRAKVAPPPAPPEPFAELVVTYLPTKYIVVSTIGGQNVQHMTNLGSAFGAIGTLAALGAALAVDKAAGSGALVERTQQLASRIEAVREQDPAVPDVNKALAEAVAKQIAEVQPALRMVVEPDAIFAARKPTAGVGVLTVETMTAYVSASMTDSYRPAFQGTYTFRVGEQNRLIRKQEYALRSGTGSSDDEYLLFDSLLADAAKVPGVMQRLSMGDVKSVSSMIAGMYGLAQSTVPSVATAAPVAPANAAAPATAAR
ncbi:hypothetical protein LMG19282_03361 [Cupriavidus campinensis]|uniref:hypothetical protein n=1 Tax=Cupriavidus campinensis TaxID=151783 RepID=UPI001B0D7424|nr:hypothetical protein [Cupriavidus campinensis]CAG2148461.1 hypothetical protein LMG19282_03361 [Cupriavidus campinensis]